MKTGYHIEVHEVFEHNPTSTYHELLFATKPIKDREQARAVFLQLSLHYPEPDFEVNCHHIDHCVTIKDLEDF